MTAPATLVPMWHHECADEGGQAFLIPKGHACPRCRDVEIPTDAEELAQLRAENAALRAEVKREPRKREPRAISLAMAREWWRTIWAGNDTIAHSERAPIALAQLLDVVHFSARADYSATLDNLAAVHQRCNELLEEARAARKLANEWEASSVCSDALYDAACKRISKLESLAIRANALIVGSIIVLGDDHAQWLKDARREIPWLESEETKAD